MKKLLFILVLISPVLSGEELEVVSYHVSKKEPKATYAQLIRARFSEDRPKNLPKMTMLKGAPFGSRFFREEDELFDVSANFAPVVKIEDGRFRAILNTSSGRLVVRAPQKEQIWIREVFRKDRWPPPIQCQIKLYEVPSSAELPNLWNVRQVPEEAPLLGKVDQVIEGNREVILPLGNSGLKVSVEASSSIDDPIIDCRLKFQMKSGSWEETLALNSRLILCFLSGTSRLIDLGAGPKQNTRLILSVGVTLKHRDGPTYGDLIWYETPIPSVAVRDYQQLGRHNGISLPHQKGKKLGRYPAGRHFLPHDFVGAVEQALASRASGNGRENLIGGPGGSIDLKGILGEKGIPFGEDDLVMLVRARKQLVVYADEPDFGKLAEYFNGAHRSFSRNVDVSASLIEMESEPKMETLLGSDYRVLSHSDAPTFFGQDVWCRSRKGSQRVDLRVRPVLVEGKQIKLEVEGVVKTDFEKAIELSEELEVVSGVPEILTKYRHGNQWRALVMRAEIRRLDEGVSIMDD